MWSNNMSTNELKVVSLYNNLDKTILYAHGYSFCSILIPCNAKKDLIFTIFCQGFSFSKTHCSDFRICKNSMRDSMIVFFHFVVLLLLVLSQHSIMVYCFCFVVCLVFKRIYTVRITKGPDIWLRCL